MMEKGQYHIKLDEEDMAGNGDIGRYVFIPGSPERAKYIAEKYFKDVRYHPEEERGHHSWFGKLVKDGVEIDVCSIPSKMGSPQMSIVLNELIKAGARRFIRSGTAGSLQIEIKTGDIVIVDDSVRDEGTTCNYLQKRNHAFAHPDVLEALEKAAYKLGVRYWYGTSHTKDDFYSEYIEQSPMKRKIRRKWKRLEKKGVLATSMEESALFIVSGMSSENPDSYRYLTMPRLEKYIYEKLGKKGSWKDIDIKAGSTLAIIGDHGVPLHPDAGKRHEATLRNVEVAVHGMIELYKIDHGL